YRSPVVLCHLEGRTNEEAARELACPVGTVKGRLNRARELLRKRLARRGLAVPAAAVVAALASQAAALPPPLAGAAVWAVAQDVGGRAASEGVSTQALSLSEEVLRTMTVTKWKVAAALALVLVAVGTGAGTLSYRAWAAADKKETARGDKELI